MDTPKQYQIKKATSTGKKHRLIFPIRAWGIRSRLQPFVGILVTILVIATIYLTGKNNVPSSSDSLATPENSSGSTSSDSLETYENSSFSTSSDSLATYENSSGSTASDSLATYENSGSTSSDSLATHENSSGSTSSDSLATHENSGGSTPSDSLATHENSGGSMPSDSLATNENSGGSTRSDSLATDENSSSLTSSDSLATHENSSSLTSSDSPVTHENSGASPSRCDLFSGKWVFDNISYPLYSGTQCTYISDQVACDKFGRKDSKYQNWRWQPHKCDLPRFNATALLEMLRGKRLVYVGDSLNRGQWVSMVCLLESAIPSSQKSVDWSGQDGSLITFKAFEYNASVDFYWAPLLLESNSDHPFNHRLPERIVRIQAIEKHAKYWIDADVIVFNTYLWWRRPTMKLLWGSFDSSDGIYKDVEMLRSYEMALKTWSDWLEFHVNRDKTKLFFASMSPTHLWNYEWRSDKEGNCYNETEPITEEGHWGGGSDARMLRIVEETINELGRKGVTVQLLNITQMSEYRKEAHPTIHKKFWEPISQEQLSNPSSYADCIHWCLPGVPDAWNEILYTLLLSPPPPSSSSSSSSSPSSSS